MTEIEKIIEILQGERIAAEVKRMEAMAVAQQWADKMEEISRSVEYLKRSHPQQIKETELTTLKN